MSNSQIWNAAKIIMDISFLKGSKLLLKPSVRSEIEYEFLVQGQNNNIIC